MEDSKGRLRSLYGAKTAAETAALAERGVVMAGNAYSSVLLVKGEPGEAERAGRPLLSGPDGTALRAALTALGYAPEDWCALAAWDASGAPVAAKDFLLALATLGPATVVVLDEGACDVVRDALAGDLVELEGLEQAMLAPGYVVAVRGMRVLNLGGFEAALADGASKQLMWARLKQVPPLDQPF